MKRMEAFAFGYMYKEAAPGPAAVGSAAAMLGRGGAKLSNLAIALMLLAPVGVGAAGGAMHSLMSSPSQLDAETAQKAEISFIYYGAEGAPGTRRKQITADETINKMTDLLEMY